MFSVQIKVTEPHLVEGYAYVLARAPEVLQTLVSRVAERNRPHVLADLRKEAPPVRYKIRWKSEKQRRAFFATDGFGKGIPTKRSGVMLNAWRVLVEYSSDQISSIVAENPVPYRQFVTGEFQQPFHAYTGWWKEQDVFEIWGLIMDEEVETAIIKSFYAIEENS
jgi:hypothetical protein